MHLGDVGGQVAFVTGGGRGFGRDVAAALVKAGAWVAICGRDADRLAGAARELSAEGGVVFPVQADVTRADDMASAAARITEELGVIELLVCNAGALGGIGPVAEVDPTLWWEDVEVCIRGTFLSLQSVLPAMITEGAGRIVVVSGGGAFAPISNLSGYAVAKTAIVRLVEIVAAEVAASGISVFAFSPGPLATDMGRAVSSSELGRRWLPALGAVYQSVTATDALSAAAKVVALLGGGFDALSGLCLLPNMDFVDLASRADALHAAGALRLRFQMPGPS